MTHPPGTVGIIAGDLARYSWFHQSSERLQLPPGSEKIYVTGLWVAQAVNEIIRSMSPRSAWALLLADDHQFEPDMVLRLLAHEVDIVAPLCCLRSPPFRPSAFRHVGDPHLYLPYTWAELRGQHGLFPVDSMGGPGAVIRRPVLDALGDPWFVGQAGEVPKEDLVTFARMRAKGFQPYVDLDLRLGHITSMVMYPEPYTPEGDWGVRLWSRADLCILPLEPAPPLPDRYFQESK